MTKKRNPSRKSKNKRARPVIIIVCDGAKTEPIYFKRFNERYMLIHVKVVPGGKSYLDLIKKGINERTGVESECFVWCVSDVDVDSKTPYSSEAKTIQLNEYKQRAEDNGIKIALSNPCFELWYLLHYEYSTGYLPNFDAVIKKLDTPGRLSDYKKNADYFDELSDKLTTALSNARKLKKHHQEQGIQNFINVSVNPYTNVWELIEVIQRFSSRGSV